MDFKDWRKSAQSSTEELAKSNKLRGRRFAHYIEEQIQLAQEQGAFDNLKGVGQPLTLEQNPYEGDKALGYSILKNSGYAPAEVELSKEIRQEMERLDAQVAALRQRGLDLRQHRRASSSSEKRAYNAAVTKFLPIYKARLQALNKKILNLNLTAPSIMHLPALDVEQMCQQLQETCPLFP